MIKVKRALISVSDKTGLIPFAKGLYRSGIEIISTGGTAKQLKKAGIPVGEVDTYTGFPEMLDGRVKTLHPVIHAGLLALRDNPQHMQEVSQHQIGLIDMVVVNLYPFEQIIRKPNVLLAEVIDHIDIGGPSMIRSAAKNYRSVAVICNPARYHDILKELDTNSGILADTVLMGLALEAFDRSARYDSAIYHYLNERLRTGEITQFPKELSVRLQKVRDLRYGENPHQQAAFYQYGSQASGMAAIRQLHGKELSFNNYLDLEAAAKVVCDFKEPAAVIVKHNNPTGVALEKTATKAFRLALQCDRLSAFGGIIGFNRKIDGPCAKEIIKSGFMECVLAPSFNRQALKTLRTKKNLRLIEVSLDKYRYKQHDLKGLQGGFLAQDQDRREISKKEVKCVTKIKPTSAQIDALLFGWTVVKHVRSNAIVLVKGRKTVGIGCGQTSRVEAVDLAIKKAGKKAKGACLASDAFFPKADNIHLAAKAGVKAIIQPGGSIADQEVIQAADKAKIAMVTTGIRHFRH